MARDIYSTYEAKARFSEVLRKVREGRTVTITYHGEPVAEVRAIEEPAGMESRIQALRDRGVLVAAEKKAGRLEPVARRPGALDGFLAERD